MNTAKKLALVAAAGLAASAYAQPTMINLSGATLLENFLNKPAATNDWLDCDGDGVSGLLGTGIDNLSPTQSTAWGANDHWVTTYRLAGSVAGYQELVSFGQSASGNCASPSAWPGFFVTGSAGLVNPPNVVLGDATTGPITTSGASKAYYNATVVYDLTGGTPIFGPLYNATNPSGMPIGANLTTLKATIGTPAVAGFRVDMAPVDVPSTWAVRGGGTAANASPVRIPGAAGYGLNNRTSVNPNGTGGGFEYTLVNLGNRNLNVSSPDCNTIFDTSLFFAPISMITNYGTGVQQLDQTEVSHFFATGRLLNGKNLVAVTREIGSGTRNGFNNTCALDPSWGVGENVGGSAPAVGTTGNSNLLGSDYRPSNKVGSGDMETTIRNTRLGMGYSGAERFNNARAAQYELVAIRCSLAGGTQYARPTLDNLLFNTPGVNTSLYSIGGPAILASVGDPRNSAMIGGDGANSNPPMANVQAAAFINNISRSIEAFVSVPGNVNNDGMPGELAATLFIPSTAREQRNVASNPSALQPNPGYSASLAAALPAFSVLDNPPINAAFGSVTLNGQTPFRRNPATYSDGVPNGTAYLKQDGATIAYNVALPARNRIAGDFNGDGLCNLNDATDMLRAFRQRNGGPTWTAPAGTGPIAGAPGGDAIIEVLGDFNGDGNFDAADVRYWADGLAIDPGTGNLDRKKGFEAVDNAWLTLTGGNNFFGTTKSGGGAYVSGQSAADVVGSGGVARGWAPVGANGVIDAQDVAYIQAQFIGNPAVTDGNANWGTLSEAVAFDLSADITGDLIVNQLDLNAINAMLGGACYANCDNSTVNPILNVQDFACFLNAFAAGTSYANCDNSTVAPVLNVQDFACFLNAFAAGCS